MNEKHTTKSKFYILPDNKHIEQQQQQKQGVQELQPFAFCVVTVNDKHKSRFKRKLKGSI